MSVPKCLFSQDLEGLTEVFGRMSAGISGYKLPLWAEFSFLSIRGECMVVRVDVILFEIIACLIQKPLNHVTDIAEKS